MQNEKKPTSTNISATRKKRPTLSEKVKKQAELIEALTAQLDQKDQALARSNDQKKSIETLNSELRSMEEKMSKADERVKVKNNTIRTLKRKISLEEQQKLSAEELQMARSAEQTSMIEELTEKVQEVEIKLLGTSLQNKHILAKNTVKMHMIAGMALGLLPAPLFDIAALSGTQLNLLRSLSLHYNVDFDEQLGKTLVTSLVSGSVPVLTVVGLSSFVKIIPGLGTVGGGIGMTVISGAVVYATGQVFIQHFEAGGTFDDFDTKHWKSYFKEQVEEGKRAVKKKKDSLSNIGSSALN